MNQFTQYLMITTSQKGGGGKSTFACALLDSLRRQGLPVAAYDADGAIGSLSDMHALKDGDGEVTDDQDPLTGVIGYNIRDESRTMLIESLSSGHRHILHDVAGGALADVQRLFADQDSLRNILRAMRSSDACLIFLHLITPDVSTIESLAVHLDLTEELRELSRFARHVAVLNRQGNRSDQDFPYWFGYSANDGTHHGGNTRHRLLEGGGAEMALPAVNERTMAMLKSAGVPFGRATQDRRLSLIDQQRLQIFCEDFDDALSLEVRALMGVSI